MQNLKKMATITDLTQLDLDKQYTYAEYMTWQFSDRVELIKGIVKKMSPTNRIHQEVIRDLSLSIISHPKFDSSNVYIGPFDVRLPIKSKKKDTTVVQPDICIVCDASKLDEQGCNGAPDLIVEILSPSNARHDTDTKFNLYEEAGVKEYWIVQPQQKSILIYVLQDGKYIGLKPFGEDEFAQGRLFPNLKIEVNEVFANV